MEPAEHLGRRLRALRSGAAIPVAELARRSGVARATLTQLEAGSGNPTLETLDALADALGVPLSDLIAPSPRAPTRVVRAGEGAPVHGSVVDGRLLDRVTLGRAVVEVFTLVLQPGQPQRRDGHPPGTREHLLFHAGRARVGPADDPVEVGPGDYVAFDAAGPHVYAALGRAVARATLVITSP